jgi:hypothetical protein
LHRLEAQGVEKHPEEEVMDTLITAPVHKHLGPEARKLQAAGRKPKERCAKTIGQSPKNSCWYSQEVALQFSKHHEQAMKKETTQ